MSVLNSNVVSSCAVTRARSKAKSEQSEGSEQIQLSQASFSQEGAGYIVFHSVAIND